MQDSNHLLLPGTSRMRDEIFRAQQAWAIWKMTAQHADQINAKNFGDLFSAIQGSVVDRFTLSLTKLYEPPNTRYQILSARTVLAQLDELAAELKLLDRSRALRWIRDEDESEKELDSLADADLTRTLASKLRNSLPSLDQSTVFEISRALEAHKTRRDKSVAHPEAVSVNELPNVTWEASLAALDPAKDMLSVLGWAYLGIAYGDDSGNYLLTSDAERAAYALRRLLKYAQIAPNSPNPAV